MTSSSKTVVRAVVSKAIMLVLVAIGITTLLWGDLHNQYIWVVLLSKFSECILHFLL